MPEEDNNEAPKKETKPPQGSSGKALQEMREVTMTTKCPVCGSEDVREEHISESMPVPYSPAASFTTTQYICNVCGESGDFTGTNTSIINDAIRKNSTESASVMLEHLTKEGISSAYFERAMRLPARTTARWKSGELSSAELALLRSVRTYPWLLEVADANFVDQEATEIDKELGKP